MGVIDDLGDDLARRTIEVMAEIGDDRFYNEVSKVIGVSSPSLQEAFLTSMRVRLAGERAKLFIEEVVNARRVGAPVPKAPAEPDGH